MKIDYDPPTRPGTASELEVGMVVLESPGHPAVVVRRTRTVPRNVYCLYIWQDRREWPWLLGEFRPTDRVEIVLMPADALATGS